MLTRLITNLKYKNFIYKSICNINKLYYSNNSSNNSSNNISLPERESMEFDVVIVGGGPAGLSAAIRLKQLSIENEIDLEVALLEKGSEIGSHIISGNVFNPKSLNELLPDWKSMDDCPISTSVTRDEFWYFTENSVIKSPYIPADLRNDGHYIISLGDVCRWLGNKAEELDVNILGGFSASEILYNNNNQVIGVATSDLGLLKDGTPGPNYERGCAVLGRQLILSEGCRGSLTEDIISKYNLRDSCDEQCYAIGFKEIWQIPESQCKPGLVIHGLGYPILNETYGGNFIYHTNDNLVYLGIVIGLEYENPTLNPYLEFQKFKQHPSVSAMLKDGECISYGARALNEGGYQSIPKLSFPGGVITGCSAGFVNVAKVKGTHYAMKSGMLAAENIFNTIKLEKENGENDLSDFNNRNQKNIISYNNDINNSWIMKELYQVRNIKPSFNKGKIYGLLHSALTTTITNGKEPWTLRNGYKCSDKTKEIKDSKTIDYSNVKIDNKLTFDILTSVSRTGTYHSDNEPSHLIIKDDLTHIANNESYHKYGAPETRFCPAKVYEFEQNNQTGEMELRINSQNCIHCKTCSIKTPHEYIKWTVPQGGGGPKYSSM